MIKYVVRENTNEKMPEANGKFYAYPVIEETMDLMDLTAHMEEHNSGYSQAVSMGVILALRKCIKEQVLAGKNVKIDGLCIFSLGIKNREGAKSAAEFSTSKNISGVKLRCRSIGDFNSQNLNLDATLKRASAVTTGIVDTTPDPDDNPSSPTDDKDSSGDNKGNTGDNQNPSSGEGTGGGSSSSGGSDSDGGSDGDGGSAMY